MSAPLSQGEPGIERMCRLAAVSRAGYYRHWQASAPRQEEMGLRDAIQRLALGDRAEVQRLAVQESREPDLAQDLTLRYHAVADNNRDPVNDLGAAGNRGDAATAMTRVGSGLHLGLAPPMAWPGEDLTPTLIICR